MLYLSPGITIADHEIELQAVRSQGPGGQNVNKVASAIHLRFDLLRSSLPREWKQRLMEMNDQRITRDGVIVIKAQKSRSQERNREEALLRLQQLLLCASVEPRLRIATKPTGSARRKRLERKRDRSQLKSLRSKVID
jgi:ribosome-associated protein